ncbi:Crp/Fnr family transcriptional regulator [Pseudoalteromonas atlantica]|uniref:Crp/Fnr family transcriptional regulator n=1 Tax=Pseudoalteromonas atlantica TaxID=288 RepID=UPI003735C24C
MSDNPLLSLGDSYEALVNKFKVQLACKYPQQLITRNTVLVQQGDVQDYGYLIVQGVLGAIHDDIDGGQKCKEFYFKNEFALLFANWMTSSPAFYQLKVINEASVIKVPLTLFEQAQYQLIKQQLIEQQLIFKEAKEAFLLLNSPEQRYCYLLKHKPHWLAQLSLSQVAMYIGISPISLSRIRKRLNLS